MLYMAIDPGSFQSAYIVWDGKLILDKGIIPNENMLDLLRLPFYDTMVIEMVASYGMRVGQTVFDTCMWIGRFIQTVETSKRKYYSVFRKKGSNGIDYGVMYHLCKSQKGDDGSIRRALMDIYGEAKEYKEVPLVEEGKIVVKKHGPNKGEAKTVKEFCNITHGIAKDEWQAFGVAVYASDHKLGQSRVIRLRRKK